MSGERTLYLVNGSIPSWRVMLALHEKGLPFVARRLRVMREPRETRSPEFLAINPRGKTPTLVEPDGTVVVESLAVLTYLELTYPEPTLLPAGARARALSFAHEAEVTACVYDPLETLFLTEPAATTDAQREAIRGALAGLDDELALWESRLAEKAFVAGEVFTLADCALYPVIAYMLRRGLSLQRFPRLDAYQRRVRARASAEASFPEGWAHDAPARRNLFALAKTLG